MRLAHGVPLSILSLCVLSSAISGPVLANPARVGLGSLEVNFDDGIWRAERLADQQLVRFTCFTADCPEYDGLRPDLYVMARPAGPDGLQSCDVVQTSIISRSRPDSGVTYERASYGGVEFHVTGLSAACGRLRHPIVFQACGERDGTIYWLTTGFNACVPEAALPKTRFDEILHGLSERGSADAAR